MLTNFFKKSKPINFLISLFVLGFFFILFNIFHKTDPEIQFPFVKKIGVLLVLLISAYILHFILIKEKSRGRHAYSIYLFSIFSISIGSVMVADSTIMAGFFIILALHRIIGMKTGMHIQKKVFDSAFFISLASLFYPPAILFLLLPYWGVFYFAHESYKNWYIPLVGVIAAFILKTTLSLIIEDAFFNPLKHYSFEIIQIENFYAIENWLPISLIFLSSIWASFNIFNREVKGTQVQKKADLLLIWAFVISIFIFLFSNTHEYFYSSFLFSFISCSLIFARYMEIPNPKQKRIKEILLITLTLNSLCFAIISLCI